MEPIITNGSSLVGYNLKEGASDSAYYSMDGNAFTKKSAPNIKHWWASGDLYFYAPVNDGVYVTSDITADGVKTGLGVEYPSAKNDIIKYVNGTHFYMYERLNTASTANTKVYYSSAAFDTNKNASWNVAKIIPNGYSYGRVADLTYADNAYYAVTDTGKIIKVTNFNYAKIYPTKCEKIKCIRITAKKEFDNIFNYLYKNSTIRLERKYNKWMEIKSAFTAGVVK